MSDEILKTATGAESVDPSMVEHSAELAGAQATDKAVELDTVSTAEGPAEIDQERLAVHTKRGLELLRKHQAEFDQREAERKEALDSHVQSAFATMDRAFAKGETLKSSDK